MGDRANVVIIDSSTDLCSRTAVFLYAHWSGSDLPEILACALKRGRERWDDAPYLARIIFNDMTQGDPQSLTGFGISTDLTDNEYPLLVVDTIQQRVVEYPESKYKESGWSELETCKGVPFAEYKGKWKR